MKRGFTLIELMLVLAILLGAMTLEMKRRASEMEWQRAVAAGRQIRTVADAAAAYLVNNEGRLKSGTDPNCLPMGSFPCEIGTAALVVQQLLPATFVAQNVWGSDYSVSVSLTGSAPNQGLSALVVTLSPWLDPSTGEAKLADLGRAVAELGQDGGYSVSPTSVSGFKGGWTATAGVASNRIAAKGQLAVRTGYASSAFRQFLRRDGSTEMTGNLQMGGFDINGGRDFSAAGPVSAGSLTASSTTATGAFSAGSMSAPGQVSAGQVSAAREVSGVSGSFSGRVLAGAGTWDSVSSTGLARITGNATAGSVSTGGALSVGDLQVSRLTVPGTLTAGTASVSGTLSAPNGTSSTGAVGIGGSVVSGETMVSGVSVEDSNCPQTGLISRTYDGVPLYCYNGVWKWTAPASSTGGCGSANGTVSWAEPSGAGLCSTGSASTVTRTGISGNSWTWSWTCQGRFGGSSASCSASHPENVFSYHWGDGCGCSGWRRDNPYTGGQSCPAGMSVVNVVEVVTSCGSGIGGCNREFYKYCG